MNDEIHRWMLWDLFLRTGTAELCDAGIAGIELVPDYPTGALGSSRIAIGRLVRFGLDKVAASGVTPMDMVSRHVSPGDVVAIASEGAQLAVMGSRLAARVIVRGGAAVVTDGCLRDANDLGRMPIAAWSTARTPTGGNQPGTYSRITGPSKLFGVGWSEGDWYAQDDDGALRLTPAAVTQIAATFGRDFKK
jgi:Aldolase/RraA